MRAPTRALAPLRTMVLLTAACSIWTALVYAECVSFGPWGMKYDSVEVVFDGTVVGLGR